MMSNGKHDDDVDEKVEKVILFHDIFDARTELKLIQDSLKDDKDLTSAKDLQRYLLGQTGDNAGWLLDDQIHSLVAKLLDSKDELIKTRIIRILALCVLKDSFINFLNLDRKQRLIMTQASKFQDLNLGQQKALAVLICNLFKNSKTSSYALYFSQWTSLDNDKCYCNAQIVQDVAIKCLESHNSALMQYGTSIMFNISTKDVKVLEKPLNEDINDFDFTRDAKLDCNDVSHSDLSERKGSFVALKAYDEMVIEICSSLWEVLISGADLQDQILTNSLRTLKNFLHMLNFADSDMADELKSLVEKDNLSQTNHDLIKDLLDKFSVS